MASVLRPLGGGAVALTGGRAGQGEARLMQPAIAHEVARPDAQAPPTRRHRLNSRAAGAPAIMGQASATSVDFSQQPATLRSKHPKKEIGEALQEARPPE